MYDKRDTLKERYINLETSCPTQKEREELIKMLYRYKKAYIFREETNTCLSKEVEIDIVHKTSFFIRSYHVKEEEKQMLDQEMKCLFILVY